MVRGVRIIFIENNDARTHATNILLCLQLIKFINRYAYAIYDDDRKPH